MMLLKKKNIKFHIILVFLTIFFINSCSNRNLKNNQKNNDISFEGVDITNGGPTPLRISEDTIDVEIIDEPLKTTKKNVLIFGPGLYRSFRALNFVKALQLQNGKLPIDLYCGIEFGTIMALMASKGWKSEKMEWFLFGLQKTIQNQTPFKSSWKKSVNDYIYKHLINGATIGDNFCFSYQNAQERNEVVQFGNISLEHLEASIGLSEKSIFMPSKGINQYFIEELKTKGFFNFIYVDTINDSIDFKSKIDRSFYSGFYGRYKSHGLKSKSSIKLYVDISSGPGPIDQFHDFFDGKNKDFVSKGQEYISNFLTESLLESGENDDEQ